MRNLITIGIFLDITGFAEKSRSISFFLITAKEKGVRKGNQMNDEMKKTVCIIPARGGSKRVPRKNIRSFLGHPIIAYPITAALESGVFSEVMISTDDAEIANFATTCGAMVPFMRSGKTSGDHAIIDEVLLEVLDEYKKQNRSFDYLCCIFPTAAFVSAKMLSESFEMLLKGAFDSVIPVVRYSPPIQRAFRLKNGKLEMFEPENFKKRTQDLELAFYDAGLFYWMKTDCFVKNKKCLTSNTGAFEIDENACCDIDTEEDWIFAERLFELMMKKI